RYWSDLMYAQNTVFFFVAGLAFFTLVNAWRLLRRKWLWSNAIGRYFSTRQFRLKPKFGYTLTLGETTIVCIMILFFSVMTLGPKPYYWPNPKDFGYSPPIATRAGFMAIAILPFQVMFATKWNPITVLTGVSHERLQVYHRWSGWIMYVLALIHTFPFIVVNIQTGMMVEYWHTDFYTWSGVVCLFPQTALVLLSIGCIRDRYYETFKSVHFVMAAWFIVLLFLHCGFTLTSAYYFIGFASVYALSLLVRWCRVLRNGFKHQAAVQMLDNKMMMIKIPTQLKWKPGQHYFVRFFTGNLHSLTSHPFTVASAPDSGAIDFFVKKRFGMTKDLANKLVEGKDVRVLLDGPYGGIGGDLGLYDNILIIAGGSGGSFILCVLRDLVARQDLINAKSLTVVYACRYQSRSHIPFREPQAHTRLGDTIWFQTFIYQAAKQLRMKVEVFFHVTSLHQAGASNPDDRSVSSHLTNIPLETFSSTSTQEIPLPPLSEVTHPGRPYLNKHIQTMTSRRGSVGMAVCGPKEMTFDVRNAVAAEQLKILKGDVPAVECFLHTEAFGW
ncbi:FAD-binding domain-domain-containing protein, partial [Naematelia encephala]